MDFYENVYESNISASPTRMKQLGVKGNLQSENRKKLFLLLPILLETINWTCEQQIIIFILKTRFYRRLQIHVYKQNAIFFILQNSFV